MNLTRRDLGASLGALATAAALGRVEAHASPVSAADAAASAVASGFPRKGDFTIADELFLPERCLQSSDAARSGRRLPPGRGTAHHAGANGRALRLLESTARHHADAGRSPGGICSTHQREAERDQLHLQYQHWGEPGRRGTRHHAFQRQCGDGCAALRRRAGALAGAQEAGSRPSAGDATRGPHRYARTSSGWWTARPN